MFYKGDFHLHTNASDGKFTPSQLVKAAKVQQLDIIAITDHDTTKGLEEAIATGLDMGIKVIPGIELSTLHNNESVHLLGYFKDNTYRNDEFQRFLIEMYDYRVWRGKKIVDNLKIYFDIHIDGDQLVKDAKGVIARPHIAQAIINAGYNYDFEYIFSNIISKDSPAYVPNKNISLIEGIKILKEVNALVVLAHPVLIKKSSIEDLVQYDLDGIEGKYPLNSPEQTEKYLKIASDNNKIVTAGSDFHGLSKNDTKHGNIGTNPLTGEYLNEFLNKLKSC